MFKKTLRIFLRTRGEKPSDVLREGWRRQKEREGEESWFCFSICLGVSQKGLDVDVSCPLSLDDTSTPSPFFPMPMYCVCICLSCLCLKSRLLLFRPDKILLLLLILRRMIWGGSLEINLGSLLFSLYGSFVFRMDSMVKEKEVFGLPIYYLESFVGTTPCGGVERKGGGRGGLDR